MERIENRGGFRQNSGRPRTNKVYIQLRIERDKLEVLNKMFKGTKKRNQAFIEKIEELLNQ